MVKNGLFSHLHALFGWAYSGCERQRSMIIHCGHIQISGEPRSPFLAGFREEQITIVCRGIDSLIISQVGIHNNFPLSTLHDCTLVAVFLTLPCLRSDNGRKKLVRYGKSALPFGSKSWS